MTTKNYIAEKSAATSFNIAGLNSQFNADIQNVIDNKTKPLGALGQLETLALQLVNIQLASYLSEHAVDECDSIPENFKPAINNPQLIVFAGDHGIAAQGVSIAPSEVTSQMVANFATGGAAINVFSRQLGWQLSVVDAGILTENIANNIINQRLGSTTQAINKFSAMSLEQVKQGFDYAKNLVISKKQTGCNLIAFGEMGIGNTTSAAAIMSAIMNLPAQETVGKGTGVSDDIVFTKQQVVEQALTLHQQRLSDPYSLLACLGGFEIVQICGAMLAAAEQKMAIVVDGFICTAAALVAFKINPAVKDYMVFAHCSGEQGHKKMLNWLDVEPLLHLGLRLGEGTGAALSLPLIQAAVAFYNDMASFAQADVTNVIES